MKKLLIDPIKLNDALSGKSPNAVVGAAVDSYDNWFVLFVDTDKDTKQVRRDKSGKNIMLNFRPQQNRPKVQAAQTPGQTLPQGNAEMAAFARSFAQYLATEGAQTTEVEAEGEEDGIHV